MKRFIKVAAILVSLVLAFSIFATPVLAYDQVYWDDLIRCLYYSELDYYEIQQRALALQNLTSRTSEQEAELQSYLTKLAHDVVVIDKWITMLKDNNVGYRDIKIRERMMNELLATETALLADIMQQKNDYVADVQANYTLVDTEADTWARDEYGEPVLDQDGNHIVKVNEDGSPINFMLIGDYNAYIANSYDYYINIYNMRIGYIVTLKGFKSVWFK